MPGTYEDNEGEDGEADDDKKEEDCGDDDEEEEGKYTSCACLQVRKKCNSIKS